MILTVYVEPSACSHERLERKPYCISYNELVKSRKFIILLCMSFSYTFEIEANSEIGL